MYVRTTLKQVRYEEWLLDPVQGYVACARNEKSCMKSKRVI